MHSFRIQDLGSRIQKIKHSALSILAFIILLITPACAPTGEKSDRLKPEDMKRQEQREKAEIFARREKIREIAEAGKPSAQYDYAMTFCCGEDEIYSSKEMIKWLCRSARGGFADAQIELGNLYRSDKKKLGPLYEDKSIPTNNRLAYVWYSVASTKGKDPIATTSMYELARMMPNSDLLQAKKVVSSYPSIPCEVY